MYLDLIYTTHRAYYFTQSKFFIKWNTFSRHYANAVLLISGLALQLIIFKLYHTLKDEVPKMYLKVYFNLKV